MTKFIFLTLLISLGSCSFKKNPLRNQKSEGHFNLYSKPMKESPDEDQNIIRITIAATNDLQHSEKGSTFQFQDKFNKEKQIIEIGGVNIIEQYLKIFRDEHQNLLLVDSGSILSPQTPNIYDRFQYDAITLGVSDFNSKHSRPKSTTENEIKRFLKKSQTPVILSNLLDLKKGHKVEWEGSKNHLIKKIAGINIGIIGVLPDELSTLTPMGHRVGLIFQDMLQATLSEARLLKSLGADLIVVLTNQSLVCGKIQSIKENLPISKVNFEPRQQNVCDLTSPLGAFLQRLPPKLIDVVITGRNKTKVANFVNSTLVIGGTESPNSMIYADLFFDKKTKTLLEEKSIIHQPITFCPYFFKETQDCFFEDKTINHSEKSPAYFLGREIYSSNNISYSHQHNEIDFSEILSELKSDILIKPDHFSRSQLKKISLSGYDLLNILEEEYNLNHHESWFPLNFKIKEGFLSISLNNQKIHSTKSYTVLANVESLYSKRIHHFIQSQDQSLTHFAWNDFIEKSQDQISTKLSSTQTLSTEGK